MVRTILCYGDSNTYGQTAADRPASRFGPQERWPGVMAACLGPGWQVIEEGLSGRTSVHDDPIEGDYLNGRRYLTPCLLSHRPLDVVILMLGTNDLKTRFHSPANEIATAMRVLVDDIRRIGPSRDGGMPEVILVSPPPVLADLRGWEPVFENAYAKSRALAPAYEAIADAVEVHFFDAGSVAECSPVDGFHLGLDGHAKLGRAMAEQVQMIGWPEQMTSPALVAQQGG